MGKLSKFFFSHFLVFLGGSNFRPIRFQCFTPASGLDISELSMVSHFFCMRVSSSTQCKLSNALSIIKFHAVVLELHSGAVFVSYTKKGPFLV